MFSVFEFRFLFWLDISCLCLTYRLYQNKCGSLLPKIVRWKYHRVVMAMECMVNWAGEVHQRELEIAFCSMVNYVLSEKSCNTDSKVLQLGIRMYSSTSKQKIGGVVVTVEAIVHHQELVVAIPVVHRLTSHVLQNYPPHQNPWPAPPASWNTK